MTFVRFALLIFLVSVCEVWLASAESGSMISEMGPAAASTASTPATTHTLVAQSPSNASGRYYVPGWNCSGWYDSLGQAEATCSAGAAAWAGPGWTLVWQATGAAPPNPSGAAYGIYCVAHATCIWHGGAFTAPDGSNYLNGNSHGGEDIFEQNCQPNYYWDGNTHTCVLSNIKPPKNIGDGGNCDGGEGGDGGGGGSGSGGNGASPSTLCSDTDGAPMAGDPINTSTGNKYLQDDDYLGGNWLTFRRFYNSSPVVESNSMGAHWRHSFERSLEMVGNPVTAIVMLRPDGKQETFTKANGVWTGDPGFVDVLIETDNAAGIATSYEVFIGALRHFETYTTAGLLQSVTDENGQGITLTYSTTVTAPAIAPVPGLLLTVTDPKGRQLNFTYDSTSHVHQVTLPDAGTMTYAYDTHGNLLSVQYPDAKTRQYVYNESSLTGGANLPNAMTGIVDEAGVRYENTTYDSTGRAT